MKQDITVYTPDYREKLGFFNTIALMVRNVLNSKGLIYQLFRRDFLMSYKKSFIGMAWILISPIIGIVSWVLFNATGILQPGNVGIPYPAFVLLSSSVWGLFMGIYSSAAGTLGAGGGFIMQVKYPHEVLLVKQIMQLLAGFFISLAVNLTVLILFGVAPDWKIILLPILVLPMFFLGAAMGLIISVVSVVAGDISSIFNTLLGFVFYATPIIFSPFDIKSEALRVIVEVNPLTYLVGGVRDIIIYGKMERFDLFLVFSAVSFVLFLISLRLFYLSENKVIEKMI
ncbi:MAG: ABC transporter permease [Candidatus Doudnabacteria bacterium]|nr:ABC transporter permease [Candidatus Doudnabacteria bacterium]